MDFVFESCYLRKLTAGPTRLAPGDCDTCHRRCIMFLTVLAIVALIVMLVLKVFKIGQPEAKKAIKAVVVSLLKASAVSSNLHCVRSAVLWLNPGAPEFLKLTKISACRTAQV